MAAYAQTHALAGGGLHPASSTGLIYQSGQVDITNYNTTLAEITEITNQFGNIAWVSDGISDNGYLCRWNYTTGAFQAYNPPGTALSITPLGVRTETLAITDDDSAASNGVAVYVHIDRLANGPGHHVYGHLESVTAGNATVAFTATNGGATGVMHDDDAAATAGLQLYFDEDGTSGSRFIANNTYGVPIYIPLSDGTYLKVAHNASPSTPGVAVYFDDDASNSYERFLFVSPTDANGSDALAGPVNTAAEAALAEVDNDTDVGIVRYIAMGTRPNS